MKKNKFNNFFNNISTKKTGGLTLIETLVAITILLAGVVLPMSVYSNSITNAQYAGDKLTAYYLAEDAIEFIKYKVSTEFNNGDGWFTTLPNCSGQPCAIDSKDDSICNGGSCDYTVKIDSNNIYGMNGDNTIFTRTVSFANNPPTDGGSVSSTVTWTQAGVTKSITLEDYVFEWR